MSARDYVFLHGGGQGSWVWSELVEALRVQDGAFGRAILLDIPGCGAKRGRDTGQLQVSGVVDELAGELDAAGAGNAVLVGHSQAGTILPSLIRVRPAMFARVIYVSCCAPAPEQSVPAMMGSGVHGQNPEEVGWPRPLSESPITEQFGALFCNDMAPAQTQAFLAKLGHDAWPVAMHTAKGWRYDALDAVPATYVACLQDGVLPLDWQIRFAERLGARGRIVRLDAGHQAMTTRPHALAEILREEAASVS